MESLFAVNGVLVQGFILATGIIGQLYVSHMRVRGFYFWAASNVALIAVSVHSEFYGMAVQYIYFFVMAAYSVFHWKKRQDEAAAAALRQAELLKVAEMFVAFTELPAIRTAAFGSNINPDHVAYLARQLIADADAVNDAPVAAEKRERNVTGRIKTEQDEHGLTTSWS